ncbi:MAG: hypothetical protein AAF799_14885 [Myxococcota bacterium]
MHSTLLRAAVISGLLLPLGCADDPAPENSVDASGDTAAQPPASSGDVEPGSTSDADPSADATAGADSTGGNNDNEPIELSTEWLDQVAGAWLGPVEDTPIGLIPQFFLEFAWEADGSLHAFVDDGKGSSFDFRFLQEDGQWVFFEEGTLPGGLVQAHTLHPVWQEGSRVRFVTLPMPGYLVVEIDVDDQNFEMDVSVLGNDHAVFDLERPS